MKRNGNAERRKRENQGAEGAEGMGSGEGVSPPQWGERSGEGAVPPFQKIFRFFVWQWYILVHSGRLF